MKRTFRKYKSIEKCLVCGSETVHVNHKFADPSEDCIKYLKKEVARLKTELKAERSKSIDFIMLKNSQGLS